MAKMRRAYLKPYRLSWGNKKLPNAEVQRELSERNKEFGMHGSPNAILSRKEDYFDLTFPDKLQDSIKNSPERAKALAARHTLLSEPDFLGRVQTWNRYLVINGARRTVGIHFLGTQWVLVEETRHTIRWTHAYPTKRLIEHDWNNNENMKWAGIRDKTG